MIRPSNLPPGVTDAMIEDQVADDLEELQFQAGLDARVWPLVLAELPRARAKFPAPSYTLAATTEELGELARAVLNAVEQREPNVGELANVVHEGVQTIAMVVRLLTEGDLSMGLAPVIDQPAQVRPPRLPVSNVPPWLPVALGELGVSEIRGAVHEDRIIGYHRITTLAAVEDEVPWCSSFACWTMDQAGIEHPASAAARAWLDWGTPIAAPEFGAVVVLGRGRSADVPWRIGEEPGPPWIPGHVCFYLGRAKDPARFVAIGGNQADSVCIREYPLDRVLGWRWPVGWGLPWADSRGDEELSR